jgi:hypothetical protein
MLTAPHPAGSLPANPTCRPFLGEPFNLTKTNHALSSAFWVSTACRFATSTHRVASRDGVRKSWLVVLSVCPTWEGWRVNPLGRQPVQDPCSRAISALSGDPYPGARSAHPLPHIRQANVHATSIGYRSSEKVSNDVSVTGVQSKGSFTEAPSRQLRGPCTSFVRRQFSAGGDDGRQPRGRRDRSRAAPSSLARAPAQTQTRPEAWRHRRSGSHRWTSSRRPARAA